MHFEEIERQVGGIPFIAAWNARYIYDFIRGFQPPRILDSA